MTYVEICERRDPRLGRIVEHDPRSMRYIYEPRFAVVDRIWERRVPITNQGNLGSCTGHAGVGALGTGGFYDTTKDKMSYDKKYAEGVYSDATKVDPFRGEWPPNDTGSSGLGIGKVLKARGLIKEYRHAVSFDAALGALMEGPVITGMRWTSGDSTPDSNGFISHRGSEQGGHEFVVYGVNAKESYVYCANSWGTRWGQNGLFKMTFDTWRSSLKDRGDVTVFIPTNVIEPAPPVDPVDPVTPVDPDLAADNALWTAAKAWATTSYLDTADASMYLKVRQWAHAKGLNV